MTAEIARIADAMLARADCCERHHPGRDCIRVYRRNAATLKGQPK